MSKADSSQTRDRQHSLTEMIIRLGLVIINTDQVLPVEHWFHCTDQALYLAKQQDRNLRQPDD